MKEAKQEEIASALEQPETGTPVAEVIRPMVASEQTFSRSKEECGGLSVGELRRPKRLEDDNGKVKSW